MNHQPTKSDSILSGFRDIDEIMGGFPRGEITVIASRSAHGKSSYALSAVANMAKMGLSIMFFATEMPLPYIMTRLIAGETGIDGARINGGEITPEELARCQTASNHIKQWDVVFDSTPNLTTETMRLNASRMHQTHNFDVIVVDTLQMVFAPSDTGESSLNHISQECKSLAKDLNVALLGVSQLKRPDGGDQTVRPVLADLPKPLVQNASMVQFIYRDELENPPTLYPNQAEIITAKNDNGPTGIVSLYFEKTLTKFMDASVHRVDLSDLE